MTKQLVLSQKELGERIQGLRIEHGLSQGEVAAQVGISRQAIGQIEKGERSIDALELSALAKTLAISVDSIVHPDRQEDQGLMRQVEKNLHFSFDKEKFRQTLLYILSVCGGKPNIGETVIYKLLYFIDFNAFEILGKPVTGMQYVRMQFGPVPQQSQFRDVIKEMVNKDELRILRQEYYGMPQKRYVALVDAKKATFSVQEKEIIDRVIQQLADMSARKIADYAHGDVPWQIAEDGELIRYTDVVDRTQPYAQVDHWSRWSAAGASDISKYLPPLSEKEIAHYKSL